MKNLFSFVYRRILYKIFREISRDFCKFRKRSRKNRIFVTASEAKQSNTAKSSRLLRPKSLAMTQKRHIFLRERLPNFFTHFASAFSYAETSHDRQSRKRLLHRDDALDAIS